MAEPQTLDYGEIHLDKTFSSETDETPIKTDPYPFQGQYYRSGQKKFEDVVVFVHFYEGNKRVLQRHIKLVNDIGFDAYAFNLEGKMDDIMDWHNWTKKRLPISTTGEFGIKHTYADQIELSLNQIPQKKIVFSFSNPSASAIEALFRRHCSDISALICDSGPSGKNFIRSVHDLLTYKGYFKNSLARWAASPFFGLGWSPLMHKDIHKHLNGFPLHFPILSIRGWKDEVIHSDEIDVVFKPHDNLNWQKLALPEAGHLCGLKDYPEDYIPAVTRFLSRVGSPLLP